MTKGETILLNVPVNLKEEILKLIEEKGYELYEKDNQLFFNILEKPVEEIIEVEQVFIPESPLVQEEKDKKFYIITEILNTEETYVSNLKMLIEKFINPIEEGKILSPSSVQTIFSSVKSIYQLNLQFLESLKSEIETKEDVEYKIAECFLKYQESFKSYSSYLTNYEKAIDCSMTERKTNQKYNQFLADLSKNLETEKSRICEIKSFLILPIQRLPRYLLLLEDLKRNITDNRALEHLGVAAQGIEDVTNYLNHKQKEHNDYVKMLQLKDILGMKDLMQSNRKLIKCIERFLVSMDGEKHNLYLFSDMLVLYKKSSIFTKSNAKVIPLLNIVSIKSEKLNLFVLTTSKLYELAFESFDDCNRWNELISTSITEYKEYIAQDRVETLKKPGETSENIKVLNVKIIKGIDFELCHTLGYKDLYCVANVGKLQQKTETQSMLSSTPVWNEQLNFNIENEPFREVEIELYANLLTKNEFIGSVRIPTNELVFDEKYTLNLFTKKEFKGIFVLEFIFYFDREEEKKVNQRGSMNLFSGGKSKITELYIGFLKKVELFQSMNENELLIIACALKENKFNQGDDIIKQGDKGDDFHIITDGSCQVWRQQEGKRIDLVQLKKGSYFGELALLFDKPRAATVTALGTTRTVSLDKESFKLLLGSLTDILKRNTEMYQNIMKKGNPQPKISSEPTIRSPEITLTPIKEKKNSKFLNFFEKLK